MSWTPITGDAAGGYFLTADDAEALIVRAKSADDNATPSGNGMIADVLARLYLLTGEDGYRARAEALIAAFAGEVAQNVFALATLLNANEMLQRGAQIVIVGPRAAPAARALLRAAYLAPAPRASSPSSSPTRPCPPGTPLSARGLVGGAPAAYVLRRPDLFGPPDHPRGPRGQPAARPAGESDDAGPHPRLADRSADRHGRGRGADRARMAPPAPVGRGMRCSTGPRNSSAPTSPARSMASTCRSRPAAATTTAPCGARCAKSRPAGR